MDNLLLQGSYYDSILKISNFGYSKSAVLDSVAVTLGLGGGGQGQVLPFPTLPVANVLERVRWVALRLQALTERLKGRVSVGQV